MMAYRRWAFVGSVAAIVAVIWLIQRGAVMPPRIVTKNAEIPGITAAPDKAGRYESAKELVGTGEFINSPPFKIADFIGKKVILVDFWTYSCINCQRTTPYLNAWWDRYRDMGLLIVGVHTPEFEFEKDPMNVRKAVANAGILYPVVQDNDFGTWHAYGNQYWPHKYLIDADGYIVYDHIGEGGYQETEDKIRELLEELAAKSGSQAEATASAVPTATVPVDFAKVRSPEMYLGAFRNESYLGNAVGGREGQQTLAMPPESAQRANLVYLSGTWDFAQESVRCVSSCRLRLRYNAKQVNLVAGSDGTSTLRILRDGVEWGTVEVSDETLYTPIDDPAGYGEHQLELEIPSGLELFTFTFG